MPTISTDPNSAAPPLRTGEFVALIALMTSLVALAIDAMLPALGRIGTDLGVGSENATQWVVTMILIGMALGQLFYGPISDSTGRKPPVYVGLLLFALGSGLSLVSPNFTVMLIGRFLQGLGAAGPRSVSMALIRDLHAGREMARIMSMIMSVFILVPVVAPALGQGVIAIAHWRMIFTLFIVLALLALAWFALRNPESLPRERRVALSFSRVAGTVVAVFRTRAAIGFAITSGVTSGAFIGYLSSSQQIFHQTYQTGDRFAVYFAILAASIGCASLVNGRMVMRWGMLRLATVALRAQTVLSALFLLIVWNQHGAPPLSLFMAYMIVNFFCVGILFGNMNALAMEPLGKIAGVGASIVSSVSLAVSVTLGAVVGQAFNGTVFPLVAGFTLYGLIGLPLLGWSARGRSA